MQITKEEVLAKCNAASKNTLMETLRIEVIDYGFDFLTARMPVNSKVLFNSLIIQNLQENRI